MLTQSFSLQHCEYIRAGSFRAAPIQEGYLFNKGRRVELRTAFTFRFRWVCLSCFGLLEGRWIEIVFDGGDNSWNFNVPASKRVFYLSWVICLGVNTGSLHLHPFICFTERARENKMKYEGVNARETIRRKREQAGWKANAAWKQKEQSETCSSFPVSASESWIETEEVSMVNMERLISSALRAVWGPNNVLSIHTLKNIPIQPDCINP